MLVPSFEIDNTDIETDRLVVYYDKNSVSILGLSGRKLVDLKQYENISPSHFSDLIESLINDELPGNGLKIVVEDEKSMLIPESFYEKQVGNIGQWVAAGRMEDAVLCRDHIAAHNASLVYTVPESILKTIEYKNRQFNVEHANTGYIMQPAPAPNAVYLILKQRRFKLILFKNYALQLMQDFELIAPTDAVYHLLNAMEVHELDPETTEVFVSGLVEKESALYKEFDRFIPLMKDMPVKEGFSTHNNFEHLPAHFFSYLSYML